MTTAQNQGGYAELVEFHSEWVENSWMRVSVKKIGKDGARKKLSIHVTEMTEGRTSKKRACKVACEAARRFNVPSVDHMVLHDYETTRKATTLEGIQKVTNIRQTVFVFGVE